MSSSPRMHTDEFYTKIAPLDRDRLKKLLWELYWREGKDLRGRIEPLLAPETPEKSTQELSDGDETLQDVLEFVALAHSGAYTGGTREVSRRDRSSASPSANSSKRLIFSLTHGHMEYSVRAMEELIDLACETKNVVYFHSENPVAAMRIVISEQAQLLWGTYLAHGAFPSFAKRAAYQFICWENPSGWTLYGDVIGKAQAVSDRMEENELNESEEETMLIR